MNIVIRSNEYLLSVGAAGIVASQVRPPLHLYQEVPGSIIRSVSISSSAFSPVSDVEYIGRQIMENFISQPKLASSIPEAEFVV